VHSDGHVHLLRTKTSGSMLHMPMADGLSPHRQNQTDTNDGSLMAENLCRALKSNCPAHCYDRSVQCAQPISYSYVDCSDLSRP
jgi:hypothetical protein